MENLIAEIKEVYAQFDTNLTEYSEKWNKAAGVRARNLSKKMEKLMLKFRAETIKRDKTKPKRPRKTKK